MGHQFSGNHPFNGNQLNCSGGNRSAATSVEPGSGSSIMAYAGICLTDDLQPHSDPYFSERSLQEISTYTSSNQAAINEVQTASLRHFGGGNEVQVVTFGPGYAQASTIQPLTVDDQRRAERDLARRREETATRSRSRPAPRTRCSRATRSRSPASPWPATTAPSPSPPSRRLAVVPVHEPDSGLASSGGGTSRSPRPALTSPATPPPSGPRRRTTARSATSSRSPRRRRRLQRHFTITAVPTPRSSVHEPDRRPRQLGRRHRTFFSPFQVRIGGNDSALIGGTGLRTRIEPPPRSTRSRASPGTATVTGAASTGFTVTYSGASAGLDVPNVELVNLSCGGCFASVEETNHGGANDSFRLN